MLPALHPRPAPPPCTAGAQRASTSAACCPHIGQDGCPAPSTSAAQRPCCQHVGLPTRLHRNCPACQHVDAALPTHHAQQVPTVPARLQHAPHTFVSTDARRRA